MQIHNLSIAMYKSQPVHHPAINFAVWITAQWLTDVIADCMRFYLQQES